MQSELRPVAGAAIDPVCGMQVDPPTARASREHEGKQYFFCCSSCAERFTADPGKYLNAQPKGSDAGLVTLGGNTAQVSKHARAQKTDSAPRASSKYFCPMDPEVVSANPG